MFKWLFGYKPSDEEQALKDDYLLDSVAPKKKPDVVIPKNISKNGDKILNNRVYYNPINNQVYFTSFDTIEDIDSNIVGYIYDGFNMQRITTVGSLLGDVYNTWKLTSNSDYGDIYNKLSDDDKPKFKEILINDFKCFIGLEFDVAYGEGYYVINDRFVHRYGYDESSMFYYSYRRLHSKEILDLVKLETLDNHMDYRKYVVEKFLNNENLNVVHYSDNKFITEYSDELNSIKKNDLHRVESKHLKTFNNICAVYDVINKWLHENNMMALAPLNSYERLHTFVSAVDQYSYILKDQNKINWDNSPEFKLFVDSFFALQNKKEN